MSISSTTAIAALPTLAAYQTPSNIMGQPSQQIQYFSQGQSNPPGQTVDLVLRNLTALSTIWGGVLQNPTFASDASAGTVPTAAFIESTLRIINACRDNIITRFSLYQQWFSANSPYKGYASNNAIDSCVSQLNIYPVSSVGNNNLTAFFLGRLSFCLTSGQYNDFNNYDIQINRSTYRFIAEKTMVLVKDYSDVPQTKTVQEWFTVIWNALQTQTCYSQAGAIYVGFYWDSIVNTYTTMGIDSFLGYFTTNSVFMESLIPAFYKILPTSTISSSSSYSNWNYYYTFLYTLCAVLLIKQLQAINIGFLKIKDLTDSSGFLVFSDASGFISAATAAYGQKFIAFLTATGQSTTNSTTNQQTGPFMTLDFFVQVNSVGALAARNASVDPNRISGSLIPTLKFQICLINALQGIFVSPYFTNLLTDQTGLLTMTINDFNTILPMVKGDIQAAINSFGPEQLAIHYGRWPFYMGTI
jgi:hypothetical protein